MFVAQPFRFFSPVGQNALAFVAEGQVYRCRHFLPGSRVAFYLFADRIYRRMRPEETVSQLFVFTKKAQQ